ncbi:Ryncolin-2,Fibrinogen C domain-containing protein 1-A,Ryncolin-1,Ryncolin-3,Fibrinogen C domain-containing protein 1-B,Fibrinogen C domain-containing protein 1 [Mytilus coruscus]|uniref:Ryncolin-2,Fibrinogen C domain-containing protein 1-A,Ryncolin-1,Ryncolin-3,Fibrinogen C domain-containing protein 1-B,Fibrinogen C domain-containing protein 1 n=1 Tax=Mytilus coruscus TaxID=42192 RepID=A0A6J8ANN7_MYTCO|nr:Ryncolin-2,Fibrinogen C domain-containing protein 1-A,Ryncolin-1,Ryncolin-3,Fibrinogen C domain-containing protein 1-B,Fibrinogen C domain-containing protein 1 [Mytilus coruscus]
MNDTLTDWFSCNSGVRQGDNLSPTLFSIFINDLVQEVKDLNFGVIQRRESGVVSFDLSWIEYQDGLGYINTEFWLGNKYSHLLTSQSDYELRIDLEDFENQRRYAKYSTFEIAGSEDKYRLTIEGYTGDSGDSFGGSNGYPFTSKDQDNDNWAANCGFYLGAWWHSDGNLNGSITRMDRILV